MASLLKRATPRSLGRAVHQSFADAAERRRLTRAGLRAVLNLAECWGLTGDEAAALLGVSASSRRSE
jgi:antitoxin Xre/MbcA/ParS-like protein